MAILTPIFTLKGISKGWTLLIGDFLTNGGAKFICRRARDIKLMAGTGLDPTYPRVYVDPKTGRLNKDYSSNHVNGKAQLVGLFIL